MPLLKACRRQWKKNSRIKWHEPLYKDHEKEHTKDDGIAKEISKDHLTEDPKYYDKLEKVEAGQKGPHHPCGKCFKWKKCTCSVEEEKSETDKEASRLDRLYARRGECSICGKPNTVEVNECKCKEAKVERDQIAKELKEVHDDETPDQLAIEIKKKHLNKPGT